MLRKTECADDLFRLFIRGIDDDGRVANFVETEQILQLGDVACSYIQVEQTTRETRSQLHFLADTRFRAVLLGAVA